MEEDLKFHQAIADAAHNPFLIGTLDYLAQFMRGAIGVTRANEARRADFAAQVREEHAAVLRAIEAATSAQARGRCFAATWTTRSAASRARTRRSGARKARGWRCRWWRAALAPRLWANQPPGELV